ncbi:hypothetical protein Tneu_0496 [Pyrobaculum neutrophilum V24Sta]|uniref:Uncharacterized protein n=1 Tax=Pyrobaculum neutrophilum (strain DSM 2338 / JCM 9278 / NBRC 100436 / V24Sta) TaxID=444157 RepID=B1YCC8_PYRNV|nr:hypothetical protein Tneu_0496 [Pyrobaculum neutrophilum V24Sta]
MGGFGFRFKNDCVVSVVALIVESPVRRGYVMRGGLSQMFLEVDSKYLSEQYSIGLFVEAWAEGEVLGVRRVGGVLSAEEEGAFREHVVGRRVRLYVIPGVFSGVDQLYFDESSWSIFRDAGVFPDEYQVVVRLEKVVVKPDGAVRELALYPYRDVVAKR